MGTAVPGEDRQCGRRFVALAPLLALSLTGCAHLESFTRTADKMRQEAAAAYMAADELDRACAELQEPKPEVCAAARKLMETVSPYVGKAP